MMSSEKHYALFLTEQNIKGLALLADKYRCCFNTALTQAVSDLLEKEGLSIEADFDQVDVNLLVADADFVVDREHQYYPPYVFVDTAESDIRALF